MNEEGGELAYLPQGTAIVPADKTDRILNGDASDAGNTSINTTFNITVQGSVDDSVLTRMKAELEDMIKKAYKQLKSEETSRGALVHGYV